MTKCIIRGAPLPGDLSAPTVDNIFDLLALVFNPDRIVERYVAEGHAYYYLNYFPRNDTILTQLGEDVPNHVILERRAFKANDDKMNDLCQRFKVPIKWSLISKSLPKKP